LIKEELVEIVDRIHASWNQTVDKPSQKAVYEAWWRILKDLSKQDVDRAVDHHVILDKFMPSTAGNPPPQEKPGYSSVQWQMPPTQVRSAKQSRFTLS
jgi:hypothetical protein